MKKLLGVLLGLVFALAVVGFFRGWLSISKTSEETKTDIHLTIDRQRIQEDVDLARDKVGQLRDGEESDDGAPGPDSLEIPDSVAP